MDDRLTASQVTALLDEVIAESGRAAAQVEALARDYDEIVEASALDSPDDEHDPNGATVAWEREQTSALLTHAREHLAALERAERQLRAGAFGRCEQCGGPIGFERLMARPTAERCMACAGR